MADQQDLELLLPMRKALDKKVSLSKAGALCSGLFYCTYVKAKKKPVQANIIHLRESYNRSKVGQIHGFLGFFSLAWSFSSFILKKNRFRGKKTGSRSFQFVSSD
jgi:hypothetical protein